MSRNDRAEAARMSSIFDRMQLHLDMLQCAELSADRKKQWFEMSLEEMTAIAHAVTSETSAERAIERIVEAIARSEQKRLEDQSRVAGLEVPTSLDFQTDGFAT